MRAAFNVGMKTRDPHADCDLIPKEDLEALKTYREYRKLREAAGRKPRRFDDKGGVRRDLLGEWIGPKPPGNRARTADPGEAVGKARGIMEKIEAARGSAVLVIFSPRGLDDRAAFELNNILRRAGQMGRMDVLLESEGGGIDAAYKMLTLLEAYSRRVRVVVPFFAKGAAAIIALGADGLALCGAGELGPVDPRVADPRTGERVPARYVKKTVDYMAGATDPATRAALAEKAPLLLIGACRAAEESYRRYLDDVLAGKGFGGDEKAKMLDAFAEEFFSSGRPAGRDFLVRNGIRLDDVDAPTEALFVELHATWREYLHSAGGHPARNALILQTRGAEFVHVPRACGGPAGGPGGRRGRRGMAQTHGGRGSSRLGRAFGSIQTAVTGRGAGGTLHDHYSRAPPRDCGK